MEKPPISTLDHVLFVRGTDQGLYEKRGIGNVDIMLIRGLPEPIANFQDIDFVQALLDDNVVVRCTAAGILADGTRHSDTFSA